MFSNCSISLLYIWEFVFFFSIQSTWSQNPNPTDFDECLASNNSCSPFSLCNNTDGSYTCSCNDGYSGNGTVCIGESICRKYNRTMHMLTKVLWDQTKTNVQERQSPAMHRLCATILRGHIHVPVILVTVALPWAVLVGSYSLNYMAFECVYSQLPRKYGFIFLLT